MDDATPSAHTRRRRTASTENATVEVVIPASPPSSSNKAATSRTKKGPKASSSRDTIKSPSPTSEPPRKTRTRRNSAKDDSAVAKADENQGSSSRTDETSTVAPTASSGIKEAAPSEASGLAAKSSSSKASNSKGASRSARKTPPAIKKPVDLAKELFDDEEEEGAATAAAASEAQISNDVQAGEVEVVIPSRKRRRAGSDDSHVESQPSSSSFTTAVEGDTAPRINASDAVSLQLRIRQLEIQLVEAKAKVEQGAGIIHAQQAIFQDLHGQCVCHICLEPAFRPNVLAPCGHVFCVHCLHSWFTKPRAGEATAPEGWSQAEIERYQRTRTLNRKKICPSCRTELACPPVEVYLVRDMLEKVDQGLKLSKDATDVVDSDMAESSNAILSVDDKVRERGDDLPKGAKLWEDIFHQDGPRRIIFDEMDGVPRCGNCASEIFDGACSNPSCGIEYDSDDEDLQRGHFDDMGDFDSDMDEDDDDGEGGPRRPRGNGTLRDRIAEFERRHGGSEGLHRGGNRLDLPDDFTGITYVDSSDNEHLVEDHTGEMRRLGRRHGGRHNGDDEIDIDDDDEDDLDGFIVRDDMSDADGGITDRHIDDWLDATASDEDGSMADGFARYRDDEEDDFIPGPRRGGRAEAIEISDDEDEERDSSVEFRGRGDRRGRGRGETYALTESDLDEFSSTESESGTEEETAGRRGNLNSSTDSSARRRRARIVDDDEDESD